MPDAHTYLALTDAELLAQCTVETLRASGPGGQKRNTTESTVRLRHRPTDITANGTESRSQATNRQVALRRLRLRLALSVREPWPHDGNGASRQLLALIDRALGPKNPAYVVALAELLDAFVSCNVSISATASALNRSSAAVSRALTATPELLATVNRLRTEQALKPLRAGRSFR